MKITERRIVTQHWYETELTKTGWDSHGWVFSDGSTISEIHSSWIIASHIRIDKFGNPFVGVAEREVEIN